MWIGPAGTITPMHHDLTNNFIAQVVGRKRVLLCPPSEARKLGNTRHVFSDIRDLEDPSVDLTRFPQLADLRIYPVDLDPGDILFVPIGWWHQVRSLDFSITITYVNFTWPNQYHETYPAD
jgi:ribosomal protein L16 Arg81 hydroxylase